jgi:hypothetical protein
MFGCTSQASGGSCFCRWTDHLKALCFISHYNIPSWNDPYWTHIKIMIFQKYKRSNHPQSNVWRDLSKSPHPTHPVAHFGPRFSLGSLHPHCVVLHGIEISSINSHSALQARISQENIPPIWYLSRDVSSWIRNAKLRGLNLTSKNFYKTGNYLN